MSGSLSKPRRGKRAGLDIIVPGLFNLPAHELNAERLAAATPALHRMLRYGEQRAARAVGFDRIMAELLGIDDGLLPLAEALKPGGHENQLLFKPIFLKADINNALVFPCALDQQEQAQLINDLADFFKADCAIESAADDSWLMQLQHCDAPRGMPHYLSVVGAGVSHLIDQSKQNTPWFKLITEMQMFLHQHPINQGRIAQGQTPANSLWCWGGDPLAQDNLGDGIVMFSDQAELKALARLVGAESAPVSDLGGDSRNKHAIVIELSLLQALKGETQADLEQLLVELEQRIFAPAMRAYGRRGIVLHSSSDRVFNFKNSHRYRFWRRPVSLIAEDLIAAQPPGSGA